MQMTIRRDHELHQKRRGRNFGLLAVLCAFVALLFAVTIVKVSEQGVVGNPSAAQGGDWGDGFKEWVRQ